MKQLIVLSSMFGWPVAFYMLWRMTNLHRSSETYLRWGYGMALAGSLLQASCPFVMGYGTMGMYSAARALIVGLTILSGGLALLMIGHDRRKT